MVDCALRTRPRFPEILTMSNPKLTGIASALKGKVSKSSRLIIATEETSDVQAGASVSVTGKDSEGTIYEWIGTVLLNDIRKKGLRVTMTCSAGHRSSSMKKKEAVEPGEMISVEVTVTNANGDHGTVSGIVDIE